MKTVRLIIVIISLLGCWAVQAQQPFMRQFTDEDGLPSSTIYNITQDLKGFLWIGTKNGICRYDGTKFITYYPKSAKDGEFIGIYIAPDGGVWAWNLSLQLFRYANDEFQLFQPKGLKTPLQPSEIIIDKKGNKYIAMADWRKKQFHICDNNDSCYTQPKINSISAFRDFFKKSDLTNQLHPFSTRISQFYYLAKKDKLRGLLEKRGRNEYTRSDLLALPSNDYYIYNRYSKIVSQIKLSPKGEVVLKDIKLPNFIVSPSDGLINIFYQDNYKNWWVANNDYIFPLDSNFQLINDVAPIENNLSINAFFQDREGGYWLATKTKGLLYMANKKMLTFNEEALPFKENNVINILSTSDGSILVATRQGNILKFKNNQLIDYQSFNDEIHFFEKSRFGNSFWINVTTSSFKINENLIRVSPDYFLGTVKSILETPKYLYVGNHGLTSRYSIKNGLKIKSKENLILDRTYSVYQAASNRIWVGTVNGLYYTSGDTVVQYLDENNEPLECWINQIIGKKNTIWIGTKSNGIYSITNGKINEHYTIKDGLSSNNCEHLVIDQDNQLWIGTAQGLNLLDLTTQQIEIIDKGSGLPAKKINSIFINRQKVGIGTPEGVTFFNKADILRKPRKLPVEIIDITISGEKKEIEPTYHLEYSQNSFKIDFVVLNYMHQNNIVYSYRMVGLDKEWKTTTSNSIQYDRLKPGKYQFKIKANYSENDPTGIVKRFNIIIEQPYWTTWWFYLFIGLLITSVGLGSFYAWLRYYQKREEKNAFINRQMSELRIGALQSQMNPHFIFNALNAIQNFFTTNDRESAMIYLARFARLIRLIFEYSKLSAIPLTKEIDFLKLYLKLEKLRFGDKIKINFENKNISDSENLMIPPLLIQPVIENALKHGLLHRENGGQLDVKFEEITPELLRCMILDNGIGRKKAKEYSQWKPRDYQSSGLQTIQERVELVNKESGQEIITFKIIDLTDEYNIAIGTKVEFTFKINQLMYNS